MPNWTDLNPAGLAFNPMTPIYKPKEKEPQQPWPFPVAHYSATHWMAEKMAERKGVWARFDNNHRDLTILFNMYFPADINHIETGE